MKLDPEIIRKLAKQTLDIRPGGINCEDWIHRVGEYIESSRSGAPIDERLAVVERHAAECPACTRELDALKKLIEDEDSTASDG